MVSLAKLAKRLLQRRSLYLLCLMSHFNQRDLQIYVEKSNEMNDSSISYRNKDVKAVTDINFVFSHMISHIFIASYGRIVAISFGFWSYL
jgi:hypothetical protein